MPRLRIFCMPEELCDWIRSMMEEDDLLAAAPTGEGGVKVLSTIERLDEDMFQIYLGTAIDKRAKKFGELAARLHDWITVRPGRIHRRPGSCVLTQSEVIGEGRGMAAKAVRRLKRRLERVARRGIRGKAPGDHVYRDILYTESAASLLQQGCVWKQQEPYKATFVPV